MGFLMSQILSQILCLQVIVLIIHWHYFKVSYARAQRLQKKKLHMQTIR